MRGITKVILTLLGLASLGWLAYFVYINWDFLYPFIRNYMFYVMDETYGEFHPPTVHIVLSSVSALTLYIVVTIFLAHLERNGLRPFGKGLYMLGVWGCILFFFVRYARLSAISMLNAEQSATFAAQSALPVKIIVIVGAVMMLVDLILLIRDKGLYGLPVWLVYMFIGLCASIFLGALIRIFLVGVVLFIMVLVAISIKRDAGSGF